MGNKYGYNGAGGGGFGGGGMQNLMKQAQQMQQKLAEAQQQLEELEIVGSASGDLVKVTVNGKTTVLGISIKPEACDPDDVEMLEDLILTCVNEALRKVDSAQSQELGKFNIPGLM